MDDKRMEGIGYRTVLWRRLDTTSLEHCTLSYDTRKITLHGTVVQTHDSQPVEANYLVSCDNMWRTRDITLFVALGKTVHDLHIAMDGDKWAWQRRAGPRGADLDAVEA